MVLHPKRRYTARASYLVPSTSTNAILTENGEFLLTEAGEYLIQEN